MTNANSPNASSPAEFTAPSVAPSDVDANEDAPQSEGGAWSAIKRIGPFLWWVITGFGLIPMIFAGHGRKSDEIVTYSVHRSFFLWAVILPGFVASAWVNHYPGSAL